MQFLAHVAISCSDLKQHCIMKALGNKKSSAKLKRIAVLVQPKPSKFQISKNTKWMLGETMVISFHSESRSSSVLTTFFKVSWKHLHSFSISFGKMWMLSVLLIQNVCFMLWWISIEETKLNVQKVFLMLFDVVPVICWCLSPSLAVWAPSVHIITGTTVTFTSNIFSPSSYSP